MKHLGIKNSHKIVGFTYEEMELLCYVLSVVDRSMRFDSFNEQYESGEDVAIVLRPDERGLLSMIIRDL